MILSELYLNFGKTSQIIPEVEENISQNYLRFSNNRITSKIDMIFFFKFFVYHKYL